VGSSPTPRTTMLKKPGGLRRAIVAVVSVFSFPEDVVPVEVADEIESSVYQDAGVCFCLGYFGYVFFLVSKEFFSKLYIR
jgi:hypothetical protein